MKRNLFLIVAVVGLAIAQQPVLIRNVNSVTVSAAGAMKIDGSAVTQPVSGTVTVTPSGTQAVSNAGTFAVQNTAATPAGSAIIGKVSIDQTTPGTTNAVQVIAALPAGANVIGHVITDSGSTTVLGANSGVDIGKLTANQSVNVAQVGGAAPDPCAGLARVFFSISQSTNTQIITGTSAKKIYFCAINIGPNADAENITVVEGTGTVCATNTIAVPGFPAATAANGWQMAANGGVAYSGGNGSVAGTSVNADNVCLFQSGSGRVAGGGSYVVQ